MILKIQIQKKNLRKKLEKFMADFGKDFQIKKILMLKTLF